MFLIYRNPLRTAASVLYACLLFVGIQTDCAFAHPDFKSHLNSIDKEIAKYGSKSQLLSDKADLYREYGLFDQAELLYKSVLAKEAYFCPALLGLASNMNSQGRTKESLSHLEQSAVCFSDHQFRTEFLLLRASINESLADYSGAISDLQVVIKEQDEPDISLFLYLSKLQEKNNELAAATATLKHATEEYPGVPSLGDALIALLERQGKPEMALAEIDKLFQTRMRRDQVYIKIFDLCVRNNMPEKAKIAASMALAEIDSLPVQVRERKYEIQQKAKLQKYLQNGSLTH